MFCFLLCCSATKDPNHIPIHLYRHSPNLSISYDQAIQSYEALLVTRVILVHIGQEAVAGVVPVQIGFSIQLWLIPTRCDHNCESKQQQHMLLLFSCYYSSWMLRVVRQFFLR